MKDQLRILIVDDDLKLRKTLSDILKAKGYKPITVATGKEALNKVREEGPALALIDLKLGDMSGLEVLREIRECSPGTECIVLTGYASQISAIDAVNLGAYGYVKKPCDMEQLLLIIQRAIEKRDAEEQILRQSRVLDGINKVFRETLTSESEKDVAETCLAVAEELTGSKFGFIGELNPGGLFDTIAISNPGWDTCKMPDSDAAVMIKDMEIRGIWGSVIEKERSLIVNDPNSHPDRVGTPEGHPLITSFLGVPLKKGGKTIGMIGLANKESGYDLDDQQSVEPLSIAFVEALNQKRMEEALRDSEEQYRTIIESSSDGIDIIKGDRIIYTNKKRVEMFGYNRPEDIVGKSVSMLVHRDDREKVTEMVIKRQRGEPVPSKHEFKGIRKDAEAIWIEVSATRTTFLGETVILAHLRDITERKRAEQKLRELNRAIEQLQDGIATADLGGKFLFVNPTWAEMHGYQVADLIGKPVTMLDPPEVWKDFPKVWEEIKKKGSWRAELQRVRKDGSSFPAIMTSSLVKDDKGRPVGIVGTCLDITERKLLEAQLQHTQKMDAVGILAGGMAHEFNNLMTAVMSYSSFLLTDLGQDDPMRKDVEEIRKAGKRASSLVKQLLAFSRKQVLQPAMLDLNSVLTDKEEMLGHLIGEDVELKMVLEQDLGPVKADPGQIEQVILNLAVNARDAMSQGGKLTIETANVEIDEFYVSTHGDELKPGPYVMLAMSDSGMGMDKETQSQIFEPFFTTKDTGEGTGLGLSTVYGIIKQSGGDIRVYSEPGQGTVFKIYLPRMEEDVESVQEADLQMERLGGSETVLLVEDNDLVRKVSRRVLEQYGYRVLEAEDGDKALMVSEQHEGLIELMVTDVVMPEMSGKVLAERLQPLRPEMKVLYMSGYADNAVVRRGVINKDVAFLEKPFTPDVLAGKVRQVLYETEKRKSR